MAGFKVEQPFDGPLCKRDEGPFMARNSHYISVTTLAIAREF